MPRDKIQGVFAAAITPVKGDNSPDPEAIINFLEFLAKRGCHGALLLGTTGEGPSFSPRQRREILSSACRIREVYPEFSLLAGTGTPSLDETLDLTRSAFDLGLDGVVVLPPYYYKNVTPEGLFEWFGTVITQSVPQYGKLFGYHIPPVSGVGLPIELLHRLKDRFPDQFAGIKDSSADPEHAVLLGKTFGKHLTVLTGNDGLFLHALQNDASGCITAAANIVSPLLKIVWDGFQDGRGVEAEQLKLSELRKLFDRFPPAPAVLKAVLAARYKFPIWSVLPPLQVFDEIRLKDALGILTDELDRNQL
jgi:4-hydroxy-tetrahydrodipicolinate synthase